MSIISCPLFGRKYSLADGPTSVRWIKLLSVEVTGLPRVLTVFRDYILPELAILFRGSVLRILPVLQVFRGSILRVLRVLGVLYCSYSQYSQYLARQYSNTLSTRSTKCTRYSRTYSVYEVHLEHLRKVVPYVCNK